MQRWHRALARLGARTPAGRDALVAGVLAVLTLVRIPVFGGSWPPLPSAGAVLAANAVFTGDFAAIAIRRRRPRTALLTATLVAIAGCTLTDYRYPWTAFSVLVCAYTVASVLPWRSAVPALAACAVLHALGGILLTPLGTQLNLVTSYWNVDPRDVVDMWLATTFSYAVPGLLGAYVSTRRAYTAELEERARRLEAEREERARAAVVEERGRIARELHDVAAHDLSAMVVQAGAADVLIDRDPAAARETMRAIRAQGRDTLSALRQLVGIMREADADGRAPFPTLARLDDLVARACAAGMAVSITSQGRPRPLPALVDLTAYRVVQEALTNALRHAPGAAVDVRVDYDDGVHLVVRNDAPPVPCPGGGDAGHGLIGMRERVQQAGGTLTVGANADGGWRVEARLPVPQGDAAPESGGPAPGAGG